MCVEVCSCSVAARCHLHVFFNDDKHNGTDANLKIQDECELNETNLLKNVCDNFSKNVHKCLTG